MKTKVKFLSLNEGFEGAVNDVIDGMESKGWKFKDMKTFNAAASLKDSFGVDIFLIFRREVKENES